MPQPLASDSTVWSGRSACRPGRRWPISAAAAAVAAVDVAIDDQPAADAGAHGDVEHDPAAASGAVPGLGQGRHVAVVSQYGRQAEREAAPIDQRKPLPAVDVMALGDHAARRIDRAAEADADGRHVVPRGQRAGGRFDLLENADGAAAGPHVETLDRRQRSIVRAHAELQLGAADFDAQVERSCVAKRFGHGIGAAADSSGGRELRGYKSPSAPLAPLPCRRPEVRPCGSAPRC